MPTATVQLAYYWLNIAGGFILLPIITLTTILSRRVKTQVVLINVYLIFSYESLLACLLFLTGKYSRVEDHVLVPRIRDGDPLCMVQAILYEPTPILLSGAALSVVLHVLILVRSIYRSSIGEPRVNPKYVIIVPYLPYLGVVIPSLIVVLKNPAVTSPHQMYCIVNKNFVSLLTSFIVVAMSLSSVMIQVWILIILKHEHVKVYARTSLDPSMVIRVLIFTLVQIAAVVLAIATFRDFTEMSVDVMVSCFPLISAIIFGTQSDMLSAWRSILTAPQSTLRMWWKGGPPSSKSSSAPRSPPPAPPAHISTSRQGVTIWSDYEMSRLGTVNSLGVTSQWSRRDSRIQTLSTAMDHHSTMSEGNMDIWQFIQQQQRSAVSSRVTPSLPTARTHKQTSITWDVGARSRSDAAASESKLYHIDESGGHDDVHEDIPSALLDDPKTTHMMSEAAAPASHPPTPASEPHNGLPTTTNIRSSPPTANTPAATAMADVSRGPSITSMPHNRYSISISFGNTVTDDPPPATPPALPPPGALSYGPDPPLGRPLPPSTLHSRPDDEPEIMEIVGIH